MKDVRGLKAREEEESLFFWGIRNICSDFEDEGLDTIFQH